ncbi:hypothetical protein J6590_020472 [Homalodisca vitripennis]|nr:hypothetical protein J6590_020472 [Homalodisca vitripennis]
MGLILSVSGQSCVLFTSEFNTFAAGHCLDSCATSARLFRLLHASILRIGEQPGPSGLGRSFSDYESDVMFSTDEEEFELASDSEDNAPPVWSPATSGLRLLDTRRNQGLMVDVPDDKQKTLSWNKKIFAQFLQMIMTNAHQLQNMYTPNLQARKISMYAFRLQVLESFLPKKEEPVLPFPRSRRTPSLGLCPNSNRLKMKTCRVCTREGKRSQTRYVCLAVWENQQVKSAAGCQALRFYITHNGLTLHTLPQSGTTSVPLPLLTSSSDLTMVGLSF